MTLDDISGKGDSGGSAEDWEAEVTREMASFMSKAKNWVETF